MKKGISVKCAKCGETSRFGMNDGGLPCQCPKCENMGVVPFPGIGAFAYFCLRFLNAIVAGMISTALSGGPLVMVILSIPLGLVLACERGINIGHRPVTACLIGLIPGSFFYFIGMPTGELRKKRK
jgi:hypothetical protein